MTNNIYNKPPKTDRHCTVPSSLLQRIQQQSTFAINFRLQYFQINQLRDLKLSAETRTAILSYNAAVEDLKELIQADWETHRAEILADRAATKEWLKEMKKLGEIDIPPF